MIVGVVAVTKARRPLKKHGHFRAALLLPVATVVVAVVAAKAAEPEGDKWDA
jgi:hypothetical protein